MLTLEYKGYHSGYPAIPCPTLTSFRRSVETDGVSYFARRDAYVAEKKITRIKSVSRDGGSCPDGDTCPTQWRTNWGTRITSGPPVTDPEVLRMLRLPEGEIAVETPEALWED
jgi:hypothetical protein